MSDLTGGSAGIGRGNAGSRVPQGSTSTSQPPAAAVLTPRQIMNQRQQREAEREARKRAEAEAQSEEQRRIDEERRRSAERRYLAAGVGPQRDSGYRSAGGSGGQGPTPGQTPYMSGGQADPSGSAGYVRGQPPEYPISRAAGSTSRRPTAPAEQSRVPAPQPQQYTSTQAQQQPQAQPRQPTSGVPTSQPARGQPAPTGAATSAEGSQPRNSNVSSFPHAFERWEQLSSRWEGLTGYWIRKLEQNTNEIQDAVTMQQLSRHLTDLSAAGANLFHAVVELQRLRASSERKFQRWFFETRAQQEQAQEREAQLEKTLDDERQGRADVVDADRIRRTADRSLTEMRRELQISKDEARRAWEELGRKEELERDRTMALRAGRAIEIGGVQVVPTAASVSRGGSLQRPSTGEGYQGQSMPTPGERTIPEYGEHQEPSPTNTDPFTESSTAAQPGIRPIPPGSYAQYPGISAPSTTGPPRAGGYTTTSQQRGTIPTRPADDPGIQTSQAAGSSFYRQQPTLLHDPSGVSGPPPQSAFSGGGSEEGSEEEISYELDEQGNVRVDSEGNPIPFRRGVVSREMGSDDEYDVGDDIAREQEQAARYVRIPTTTTAPTSAPDPARSYGSPADYEGEGFGTEWETIHRHHHPTRLSDVLEEDDERSRTSPSRASQGSRGVY